MPWIYGRYTDLSTGGRVLWGQYIASPRRRADARGYVLHREYGAWVLRPAMGWRSFRWVTPPLQSTREVSADDRAGAIAWHAEKLGLNDRTIHA